MSPAFRTQGSNRRLGRAFGAVSRLGAAFAVGAALGATAVLAPPRARQQARAPFPQGVAELSQPAIVEAVRKVAPAVVSIQVTPAETRQGQQRLLAGSGTIVDPDGYILTAARLVERPGRVRVLLSDGRMLNAQVVAKHVRRHLAVLKVAGRGLPTVALGRSRSVPIGTWVVAVGRAPSGQSNAAVGVLSARDRGFETTDGRTYEFLLQTDAAINPDNSGGPLVNLDGRVVGVSLSIVPSAYAQGLGFAITSEFAKRIAQDLIRYRRLHLAWLGVEYNDLTQQDRRRLRVREGKGVVINQVLPDTPAREAGLRAGDVIVAFNDFPIRAKNDFRWHMTQARPGQTVHLQVLRRGRPVRLSVRLSEIIEE